MEKPIKMQRLFQRDAKKDLQYPFFPKKDFLQLIFFSFILCFIFATSLTIFFEVKQSLFFYIIC